MQTMKYVRSVCIHEKLEVSNEEKLNRLLGIINKCQSVAWNRRCRWREVPPAKMILCLSYEQSNVTRPMDKDHRMANGRRLVRLEDPRLISASINHPRGSSTQFSVRSSRNGDVDWIPRQTRSKHLSLHTSLPEIYPNFFSFD